MPALSGLCFISLSTLVRRGFSTCGRLLLGEAEGEADGEAEGEADGRADGEAKREADGAADGGAKVPDDGKADRGAEGGGFTAAAGSCEAAAGAKHIQTSKSAVI